MGTKLLKIVGAVVMGFVFSCNLLTFGYSEDLFSQADSQMKKLKSKEEKVAYLQSLGPRKVIILGSQVWETHGSEDAYWVGYYGLVKLWERDVSKVIESVPVIRCTEIKLHKGWREMLTNSLNDYVKQSDLSTETKLINEALEFIGNESNPVGDRSHVTDFIGDAWFEYFNKALTARNKGEIFDALNVQAERIVENVFALSDSSPQVKDSRKSLLQRFYQFYVKETEFPSRFKESPYFPEVQSKIQSMLS